MIQAFSMDLVIIISISDIPLRLFFFATFKEYYHLKRNHKESNIAITPFPVPVRMNDVMACNFPTVLYPHRLITKAQVLLYQQNVNTSIYLYK